MKYFIVRVFAVIGAIVTLGIVTGALTAWMLLPDSDEAPEKPNAIVLSLDFSAPISEPIQDFSIAVTNFVEDEPEATPLISIIRALHNAKNDPKVKGVFATFGSEPLSLVHAQEIAAALDDFKQSGKFTYVYAPSYGDFTAGGTVYALASHFENIWLQPIGSVGIGNLGIEAPFGKTALNNLGIQTDFMRREEYKSVMENVSQDSFSPTVRANMQSMLGDLSEQIAQAIATGRKIETTAAKELMAGGPYTSNEAVSKNLVTKLGYKDEIEKEVKDKAGKKAKFLDVGTYLYHVAHDLKDKKKNDIAVIYAQGVITDEPVHEPSGMSNGEVIDTQSIVDAFKDATEDKKVKAILFRIDSPGGSPVASETIRRAIVKAKEKGKPVFVSMGRVAASGGYWIAMNGDKIIADPATITGSIGVVSGKFVLGGLYDKFGVKWDSITTGDNTNMWSSRTPFTEKGRERINAMLDETYKAFTDNVAAARKIAPEKMPDIAKGRVFTGQQALAVGLVDELGGLNTAVAAIKTHLKLKPEDRVSLRQFPEPETPVSALFRLLRSFGMTTASLRDSAYDFAKARRALAPLLSALDDNGGIKAKLPSYFLYE